jgi:hypothetical protein
LDAAHKAALEGDLMKQIVLATLAALTLAGCGSAPVIAPAAANAGAIEAAAKKAALPKAFVVEHVALDEGPSEHPGHTMPIKETYTITGKGDGAAATIVITGNNPNGDYYISFFGGATYNGKAVTKAQYDEFTALLKNATEPTDKNSAFMLHRAETVLAFRPKGS